MVEPAIPQRRLLRAHHRPAPGLRRRWLRGRARRRPRAPARPPPTPRSTALLATDPPPAGTVGHHFWFLPPGRLPAADAALRESGALAVADELVAPLHLDLGLDHIQVALNIPPYPHRPGAPHIDGHRPGEPIASFTMLARDLPLRRVPAGLGEPVGLAGLPPPPPADVPRAGRRGPHRRQRACRPARPARPLRPGTAAARPPRRPAAGPLPARPQHRRQHQRPRASHPLLPPRRRRPPRPLGRHLHRPAHRVRPAARLGVGRSASVSPHKSPGTCAVTQSVLSSSPRASGWSSSHCSRNGRRPPIRSSWPGGLSGG